MAWQKTMEPTVEKPPPHSLVSLCLGPGSSLLASSCLGVRYAEENHIAQRECGLGPAPNGVPAPCPAKQGRRRRASLLAASSIGCAAAWPCPVLLDSSLWQWAPPSCRCAAVFL